jgi:hypothetical protein
MQWHMPGQNYTGPGTHIVTNIIKEVPPSNLTDLITMMHDVDYMTDETNSDALKSDLKAIYNSDFTVQGLLTKIGLAARSLLTPGLFYGGNKKIGETLKEHIKSSVFWRSQFNKYKVMDLLKQW